MVAKGVPHPGSNNRPRNCRNHRATTMQRGATMPQPSDFLARNYRNYPLQGVCVVARGSWGLSRTHRQDTAANVRSMVFAAGILASTASGDTPPEYLFDFQSVLLRLTSAARFGSRPAMQLAAGIAHKIESDQ